MYLIPPKGFTQKHEHKLPINYKPEYAHLFKPDYEYLKVKLGVRELKNVFVNHYGLVIKNGLLVKGCAPNIGFGSYDDGFYFQHWRKAVEQMLVSRFGESIPSMRLDDSKRYLLIHSPWFSYYFWITECLPRLLMVKDHLKELTLICPESWRKFRFVQDTLALFQNLETIEIPTDVHLWVKNLIMPEVKPWTPMFIPEQVNQVRNFLFTNVAVKPTTAHQNIYISRGGAKRRNIVDNDHFEAFLESNNFRSVRMEELTFYEQIQLMRNTSNLVSVTGAGLINTLFLPNGSSLLDLTNKRYIHNSKYKFHYWKLCNILQVDYCVQFCETENSPEVSHFSNQNLILDYTELTANFNTITNKNI